METLFDERLELFRKFGDEKVGDLKFRNLLYSKREDIDYFQIIEMWLVAVSLWKKSNFKEKMKDYSIFLYRRHKSKKRRKSLEKRPPKNAIAFFPISESTIMLFEPIIGLLNEKKQENYMLRYDYSMDGIKKEIEKRGLSYVSFEKYLNKEMESVNKNGVRKKISKISEKVLLRKKKYSVLRGAIEYYFGPRKRFLEIVDFVEGFKNFLEMEHPSIVFLPDETIDIARAASYLCKKKNVPCLVMQHGSITEEGAEPTEINAIKKIVFGKAIRDFLVNRGMNSKKIEITGSPLYDSFSEKISKDKIMNLKEKFGIEKNDKVILFASTGDNKRALPRLTALFKFAKKTPNIKIIIKQHPAEYHKKKYENFYRKLAEKNLVDIIISKDELRILLNFSDAFVTDFSTTILEALIVRKPIILMNFEKEFLYKNYPQFKGVIWHVYNGSEFMRAISEAFEAKMDKKKMEFIDGIIEYNMYKSDGKASERISKLIEKYKKKNLD